MTFHASWTFSTRVDAMARSAAAELARTQSPATARHSLGVLRRVFAYAVQDGAIPRNPAAGIRLPKVQGNEPQPLTHSELWLLAGQFDSKRDRVLIVVPDTADFAGGRLQR
jgi:site-specific recombinase XerC